MAHDVAMTTVAVTGGIAMGKTSVFEELQALFPEEVYFDADQCVGELLTRRETCEKIQEEFGKAVLEGDGKINRSYLRYQVFDSAKRRAALENILHPEVYNCYLDFHQAAADNSARISFLDIPLLFESGDDYQRDVVIVVACDKDTQLERLNRRPGITSSLACRMVDSQWPIERKIELADHVIWNSGSQKQLQQQTKYFAQWLKQKI
ncbi:MAG: dephospho-CoA kinase [Verrucomicrobiaceae bacterium]|nr:dephospho-CoA kinase [Verrucomicrobiaceae bacterium]